MPQTLHIWPDTNNPEQRRVFLHNDDGTAAAQLMASHEIALKWHAAKCPDALILPVADDEYGDINCHWEAFRTYGKDGDPELLKAHCFDFLCTNPGCLGNESMQAEQQRQQSIRIHMIAAILDVFDLGKDFDSDDENPQALRNYVEAKKEAVSELAYKRMIALCDEIDASDAEYHAGEVLQVAIEQYNAEQARLKAGVQGDIAQPPMEFVK